MHAGEGSTHGDVRPVATPLYQTVSFSFPSAAEASAIAAGESAAPWYSRIGNPTVAALERAIADLEGAESAFAAASGMGAVATLLLANLRAGDHVVADSGVYGGTYNLLRRELPRFGVETTFIETNDPARLREAWRPNTRLLYVDSPGNPTLRVLDLPALAELARARGAWFVVDNTFCTPYLQRPLELGAHAVVHSATKYLSGHGDAIAGLVAGECALVEPGRIAGLREFGAVCAPFVAWLVERGLHTLPLRMERHCASALRVAEWLESRPEVAWVRYPWLPSHPQRALARRQMRGGSGVLVFELKGGISAGAALLDAVELCTHAVSLGDTRTLIMHPASTMHAPTPPEERLALGVTDGLVRLSVGLEDVEDIIGDLEQALGKARAAGG